MSNSKLVTYTQLSPHCNKPRRDKIRKITIHHAAGNITLQGFGSTFNGTREVSANYGVDTQGRIGIYVEECDRAWTSSSADNDHQAITIEVANDGGAPNWHVSDAALEATIKLCVDICQRNGIAKLDFTGDKSGNLTMHKYFAATGCPGPYLESKFPYIANEVNKRLGAAVAYSKLSDLVGTKSASITTVFKEKGSCWSSGWHNGVDIAAAADTPIYAAADGVVVNADTAAHNDGYGNRVVIKHADGKATLYAHMIAPAAVKVGQSVNRGQL
ncbi:MAG: peptidoglycan DD-metalloendopeptidase family protein, partial [Oscillospiraceae bacterium]|nr:peptidoglycan DD-metalloendopeptidase family protein [Oscillospiraceae bacterium]